MNEPILECVPNFSEGRDAGTIAELIAAGSSVKGARLLDATSDVDHNRTVLTITGAPDAVAESAFRAIAIAAKRIRLPLHQGVHPRIGSADVVPFVPIAGMSLAQSAAVAETIGERVWLELRVPVFLYEAAARSPERIRLETIRARSFRGKPDFGHGRHPTAGATVVGARNFLIAWNIHLDSQDLAAARSIAGVVRQSSGGLHCVKALGLPLASRGRVQISLNLTDFEVTPLHVVFDCVKAEAARREIEVAGSELIGLIPQRAIELSAGHDLRWMNFSQRSVLEHRLAEADAL